MNAAAAARALLSALEQGHAVATATLIEPPTGARLLLGPDGPLGGLGDAGLDRQVRTLLDAALDGAPAATHAVEHAGRLHRVLVEAHAPRPELVIVGAGHIALPLAAMADTAGFAVTVLDDRAAFADAARFPVAASVRHVDFEGDPFEGVRLGERSHVVLVTRAHRYDFDCLKLLLDRDIGRAPSYVGIIGSRRRIRAAFQALVDDGIAPDRLRAVRAPIGLELAAETPAEIAVSILAEIVAHRRGVLREARAGRPLTESERVAERLVHDGPIASQAP